MRTRNLHTDEELMAFANKMVDIVEANRDRLLKEITEFHEASCVATVASKEHCTLTFCFKFMKLMDEILVERETTRLEKDL